MSRKPRKPRVHPNAEIWPSPVRPPRHYVRVRGSNIFYADILTSHEVRVLAKRLIAMADWIDAQKADRQAGGGGE